MEYDYIEHTEDFKYRVGDFITCYFLPIKEELQVFKAEVEIMIRVEEVNEDNNITKLCVVKSPPSPLTEILEDGTIKALILNVWSHGHVDIMNEDGFKRYRTLVPESSDENIHFVMGNIVARPI